MSSKPSGNLKLFSPYARPYGMTYQQWSRKWWIWLLQVPMQNNPAFDVTGRNAYNRQDDPNVFFLCQTFDANSCAPFRTITIKKGRSLFLPILNWISVSPEDGRTDKELILKAGAKMDTIRDLKLTVNGHPISTQLERYRVKTHPFQVNLPEDNILKLKQGVKKVVSDGYWILTEEVTIPVRLETFGSCSAGLTKIGVNYEINIVD